MAALFAARLFDSTDRLAALLESGRCIPEVGRDDHREILVGSCRLMYRIRGAPVEILTVIHGARLFEP